VEEILGDPLKKEETGDELRSARLMDDGGKVFSVEEEIPGNPLKKEETGDELRSARMVVD
jgi:hypothetical protein